MFYLLNCRSHSPIDFTAIVGIADSKQGVMELLFNYHKYLLTALDEQLFETSNFDLEILRIRSFDYKRLQTQIKLKLHLIRFVNFEPECQSANFLFTVLVDDQPRYDIFEQNFHDLYNFIVNRAKRLIL